MVLVVGVSIDLSWVQLDCFCLFAIRQLRDRSQSGGNEAWSQCSRHVWRRYKWLEYRASGPLKRVGPHWVGQGSQRATAPLAPRILEAQARLPKAKRPANLRSTNAAWRVASQLAQATTRPSTATWEEQASYFGQDPKRPTHRALVCLAFSLILFFYIRFDFIPTRQTSRFHFEIPRPSCSGDRHCRPWGWPRVRGVPCKMPTPLR